VRTPAALADEEQVLRGLRYQTALAEPDAARAARALRALAREDRDFLPAWVSAGDQLLRVGRRFAARRVWERAARHRPATALLERLTALHTAAGTPARATRFLHRLQRRHPHAPAVPLILARHLISQAELEQAAAVLDALPDSMASEPSLLRLRAELYRGQGDPERAAANFARVADGDGAFHCTVCHRHSATWQGQCAECRRWNTMVASADRRNER
jgi:predicted Zn-dependent protease